MNKSEKLAALSRVLAAAKAEVKAAEGLCLYDCAIWILYACTRSDAITTAREFEEDTGDVSINTVSAECEEAISAAREDPDGQVLHETDVKRMGEELDPEFCAPARDLRDWID